MDNKIMTQAWEEYKSTSGYDMIPEDIKNIIGEWIKNTFEVGFSEGYVRAHNKILEFTSEQFVEYKDEQSK
jgi:hypothetical protein